MFKVETRPTTEWYCPNGHEPLTDNHSVKFCHLCGAPLRQQGTTYDAALCANCDNPVDPTWGYCPYCGQGGEPPADPFPGQRVAATEAEKEVAFPGEPVEEKTPDDVTGDDVPDIYALLRICCHFWQMGPIEVCGQLGYKTMLDLKASGISPREAFLTIRDLKQAKQE